jgi:uncharacterized phiE125 gp8 family phage protein
MINRPGCNFRYVKGSRVNSSDPFCTHINLIKSILKVSDLYLEMNESQLSLEFEAIIDTFEQYTHRILLHRNFQLIMDQFPGSYPGYELHRGPIQSITSITYIQDQATETLDSNDYQLYRNRDFGRITPTLNSSFPIVDTIPDAVTTNFVAGIAETPAEIPSDILLGLMDQLLYTSETGGVCSPNGDWSKRFADLIMEQKVILP